MAKTYGYARVSTREQHEDRQVDALLGFGVIPRNIFLDKMSGKDFERPRYQRLVHSRLRRRCPHHGQNLPENRKDALE